MIKLACGGGRASAATPLLDEGVASSASRRLASARPALAPECEIISAQAFGLFRFSSSCFYAVMAI
jgi:hypothetical protein